jgi:hypothetical protein
MAALRIGAQWRHADCVYRLSGTNGEVVEAIYAQQTIGAGSEDRATLASDPSAAAGGIQWRGPGAEPGLFLLSIGTHKAINA